MLTWIIFSIIPLLCWTFWSNSRQLQPGPKRFPTFGCLWSLWILIKVIIILLIQPVHLLLDKLWKMPIQPVHLLLDKLLRKHGPIIGLQLFGNNVILLGNTTLFKSAFTQNNLSSRNYGGYTQQLYCGKGFKPAQRAMGVVIGTLWKDHRDFFLKHFKNSPYGKSSFEMTVQTEIDDLMEIISTHHKGILCISNETFAITVLNIIWKIVAGIRFSHTDPKIKQMLHNLEKLSKIVKRVLLWDIVWINRWFPRVTQIHTFVDILDSLKELITCEIINHKQNIIDGTPNDFMESFLQAAQQNQNSEFYSDNELVMACVEFFMAGFDTTTSTLQWAILMMVLNPTVQCKVREEIKNNVDNELLLKAHRPKLPYTNAVLSEVYRFCSIVPFPPPRYATDNITLLDYEIPKGSLVVANIYTIHHNSDCWNDPQSFDPERFLSKDGIYKNNENLIPFGVGKRKCLGEDLAQSEMFMIFGSLIRRFNFALPDEHVKPSLERQEGTTCEPLLFSVIVTDLCK